MSINDIIQKKKLFQKMGLGTPQIKSSKVISQSNTPTPPPKTNPPQTPPAPQQPVTKPAKPGCGGCKRKRS